MATVAEILKRIFESQWPDSKVARDCVRGDKAVREEQSECQIDKTLKDSFPASDPPSWH